MRWSGFLGVPLLMISALSMPLISLGLLLYHRGSLDLTSVRLRYGFIYWPYRCASKARASKAHLFIPFQTPFHLPLYIGLCPRGA